MNEKQEIIENKETQLTLELHEPISNKFHNLKGKIDKSLLVFETRKFARSWAVWFSVVFSIAAIGIQTYYLLTKFSTLPTLVPILQMYTTLSKTLVDKEYLFAYPIFSLITFLFSFYIASTTHSKNNIAAVSILLINTISIIILGFTLIELIAIYNV
jgi:hypothetical protein